MIYGSVCSGIESASVAWSPIGWHASFLSEIETFPRAVLAYHYPSIPLHGDFTTIEAGQYEPIDILVGGTPCQSFSIAGLRGGLGDDRGNLALEYLRLAQRLRPKWLVWENVPGVLSSGAGRDFGSVLGGLGELGYGFAYRVLDAQFVRVDGFGRAVPQRRRRVFVVGYLGDWRRAAAVLFERESLSGNSPPRRSSREVVAPTLSARTKGGDGLGTDFDSDGGLVAKTLGATTKVHRDDPSADTFVVAGTLLNNGKAAGSATTQDAENGFLVPVAHTLNAKGGAGRMDYESETLVAHSLRGGGFDASEDGTGRGTPLVPIAFSSKDHGADASDDVAPTLRAMGHAESHANAGGQLGIAYRTTGNDGAYETGDVTPCLNTATDPNQITLLQGWQVRRLTPKECERLQGFPDGYTDIPYRRRSAADGPRYKALGNSMAVNVMRWVGHRIAMVEKKGQQ